MELTHILVTGLLGVISFMAALWLISLYLREADIVDFGWAASLGLLGLWYGVTCGGDPLTRFLVSLASVIWSGRLAGYLLVKRVLKKGEDGRYVALRESWGASAYWKFFIFFQAQALLAFVLSVSYLVVALNEAESHRLFQVLGLFVIAVSIIGESAADLQLSRFLTDPSNHRGKVCTVGLWRYSRHPNYFFEWLGWCAFPFMAWGSDVWWLTLLSPALILFLILKVTGIPPTEARALQTRRDEYLRYQHSTSAFIPWFPKKEKVVV